jgi:hypothetical protein
MMTKIKHLGGLYGRTYSTQEGDKKGSSENVERETGRKESEEEISGRDCVTLSEVRL